MTTDNQQPETAADVVTRCPRCGCEWGSEEIERDTCFACGWFLLSWEDFWGDEADDENGGE